MALWPLLRVWKKGARPRKHSYLNFGFRSFVFPDGCIFFEIPIVLDKVPKLPFQKNGVPGTVHTVDGKILHTVDGINPA